MKRTIIAILAVTFLCAGLGLAQAKHPTELKYSALKYEPPDRGRIASHTPAACAPTSRRTATASFQHTAIVNCGDLYVRRTRPGSAASSGPAHQGRHSHPRRRGDRGAHRFPRRLLELHGRERTST